MTSSVVAGAPDPFSDRTPLTLEEPDQLFAGLNQIGSVALGVSGGPDSLALLYSFNDWRRRNGWAGRAHVFTVDHGLRQESAAEAAEVAAHCAALALPHETLVWKDGKPLSNVQAAARDARYRLMAERMLALDLECLMLAHHRDDQAETFLDRLTRGSGAYGLGAMAADQTGPYGVRILRPLLSIPKSRLVADLAARNVAWAEDPSNQNEGYKRVRLRKIAGLLEREGLSPERLLETSTRLRRAAEAIDVWVENVWSEHLAEHPAGPLSMPARILKALPEEVRLRLLARMVQRATGGETPVRLAKLEHLERAVLSGDGQYTLSGAVILRQGERVYLWREPGRQEPEKLSLFAGSSGTWDGRFAYLASHEPDFDVASAITLGPFKAAPKQGLGLSWPADWPKPSFACAPALWRDNKLLLVPGLYQADTSSVLSIVELRRLPGRAGAGRF